MTEFYSLFPLHYWSPLIPTHHLNFYFLLILFVYFLEGIRIIIIIQALIHIADTQIIQLHNNGFLEALVNNLLVWGKAAVKANYMPFKQQIY